MATIADIRAKYPQYNDMSDEQLAVALHRKFYSDMPFGDFSQKIGLRDRLTKREQVDVNSGASDGEKALNALGAGVAQRWAGMGQTVGEALTSKGGISSLIPGVGAAQSLLGIAGIQDDLKKQLATEVQNASAKAQAYDQHGPSGVLPFAAKMVGDVAAVPIPAMTAQSLAGRLGMGAVQGAAMGATQLVPEGQSRIENAATGALTGAVGQAIIGEPLRALAAKLAALVKPGKANITPEAQAALDYAKANNLPINYDDVAGSPVAQALGTAVDELPIVGSGKNREAQAKAAEDAARKLVDQFQTGSGRRAADVIRESAQQQLERARAIKNKLYNAAFGSLNKAGELDARRMRGVASALAKEEEARGTLADVGLIKQLQSFVQAPKFNFEGWHQARAQLGDIIRSRATGESAVLGDRAIAALARVKSALDADLNANASAIGGHGGTLWARADDFYKRIMPKYKRGVVADLLKSNNPDAIAERILGGSDREGMAREIFNALSPKGRAEVKGSLMAKALDGALSPDKPFSPARFAAELDKQGSRVGVFFGPQEKRMIEGLQNYMQHIKRAGQYMENPPTGKRLVPYLVGGAAMAEPTAMVGIAGSAGVIRSLFRTSTGRDLLLRLGSTSPGSQQAQRIVDRINALGSRAAAAESVRSNQASSARR